MGEELRVCRVDDLLLRTYQHVRLAMLLDAPSAFGSTYAREAAFTDQDWQGRLASGRNWLAFIGDRPVGAVTLFHADEQPEGEEYLVAMWVSASVRGRGVGAQLVETVLEDARARGLRRVTLDVADHNAAAIALYRRLGFEPTGRTDTLPHSPDVSEFEMARSLD